LKRIPRWHDSQGALLRYRRNVGRLSTAEAARDSYSIRSAEATCMNSRETPLKAQEVDNDTRLRKPISCGTWVAIRAVLWWRGKWWKEIGVRRKKREDFRMRIL